MDACRMAFVVDNRDFDGDWRGPSLPLFLCWDPVATTLAYTLGTLELIKELASIPSVYTVSQGRRISSKPGGKKFPDSYFMSLPGSWSAAPALNLYVALTSTNSSWSRTQLTWALVRAHLRPGDGRTSVHGIHDHRFLLVLEVPTMNWLMANH